MYVTMFCTTWCNNLYNPHLTTNTTQHHSHDRKQYSSHLSSSAAAYSLIYLTHQSVWSLRHRLNLVRDIIYKSLRTLGSGYETRYAGTLDLVIVCIASSLADSLPSRSFSSTANAFFRSLAPYDCIEAYTEFPYCFLCTNAYSYS